MLTVNFQARYFPHFTEEKEESWISKETSHKVILGNRFWKGREDWVDVPIQSFLLLPLVYPLYGFSLVYRSIGFDSNPRSAVDWLCDLGMFPNLFEFQLSHM